MSLTRRTAKLDNTVLAVFGRKGGGKSSLVCEIIGEHERVIIIDTQGDYDEENVGAEVIDGLEDSVQRMTEVAGEDAFVLSLRVSSVEG